MPTNLFDSATEALNHTVRRTLGVVNRSVGVAHDTLVHPSRLPGLGVDAAETARSAVRQLTVVDHAHVAAVADRSLRRHFDILDVPFDDARHAAKSLGGSLNDFFVCGAAGGAGPLPRGAGLVGRVVPHRDAGEHPPRQLLRRQLLRPTRVVVPTGVDDDPTERFTATSAVLTQTKHERAIGLVSAAAGVVNLLPTSVLVRFARQQVETVDFTTSNLRAAPFELYIGGALIEGTYPLGPLAGTAFNLTMMSYAGTLNMGLHADVGAVDDPAAAARPASRRRSPSSSPRGREGGQLTDRLSLLGERDGQEGAHIEEQVGHLVGRHQLTMAHVAQPGVDEGEGLGDRLDAVLFGVGH